MNGYLDYEEDKDVADIKILLEEKLNDLKAAADDYVTKAYTFIRIIMR